MSAAAKIDPEEFDSMAEIKAKLEDLGERLATIEGHLEAIESSLGDLSALVAGRLISPETLG